MEERIAKNVLVLLVELKKPKPWDETSTFDGIEDRERRKKGKRGMERKGRQGKW